MDEPTTVLKENVVHYGQCDYTFDNHNIAWEIDLQKNKTHSILPQKEIIGIFIDASGKPIFQDKGGIFYYRDGTVLTNAVIAEESLNNSIFNSSELISSKLDESSNFLLSTIDTSTIPTGWQLQYFGYLGVDPNALAPNGSGLTILQCYLQGVTPIPPKPITMTVGVTGPFRSPATVTLVASITHPPSVQISHVDFFYGDICLGQATQEPYQATLNQKLASAHWLIQAIAYDTSKNKIATSSVEFDVFPSNRYFRGEMHGDINDVSSIIAIDFQRGI